MYPCRKIDSTVTVTSQSASSSYSADCNTAFKIVNAQRTIPVMSTPNGDTVLEAGQVFEKYGGSKDPVGWYPNSKDYDLMKRRERSLHAEEVAKKLRRSGVVVDSRNLSMRDQVAMETVEIRVYSDNCQKFIKTRALIDNGSNCTLVSKRLAEMLGWTPASCSFRARVNGVGGIATSDSECFIFNFSVTGENMGSDTPRYFTAFAVEKPSTEVNLFKHPEFRAPLGENLVWADSMNNNNREISLLIGADQISTLEPFTQQEQRRHRPQIRKTIYGWTISGNLRDVSFLSDLCESLLEKQRKAEDGEFPKVNPMKMIDGLLHKSEELHAESNFCIIESRMIRNEHIKKIETNNVRLEIRDQLSQFYNEQDPSPLNIGLQKPLFPMRRYPVIHEMGCDLPAFFQKRVDIDALGTKVTNSEVLFEHGCASPVIHEECSAELAIFASNCAVDGQAPSEQPNVLVTSPVSPLSGKQPCNHPSIPTEIAFDPCSGKLLHDNSIHQCCSNLHSIGPQRSKTTNPDADTLMDELMTLISVESMLSSGDLETEMDKAALDKKVEEDFIKNIRFIESEGRYEITLPMRPDMPPPGNNKRQVLAIMYAVERELLKDEEKVKQYNSVILDLMERGVLEEIPRDEWSDRQPKHPFSFVSHRPVYRESVSTPCRIVVNCSLKNSVDKCSFNDRMYTGPNLLQQCPDLLLRASMYDDILVGDISKMFHMIKIKKEQRDYSRIVWRFCDRSVEPKELRFPCVAFGLKPGPFIAGCTLNHHAERHKEEFPAVYKTVLRDTYMDDVMREVKNVEHGLKGFYDVNQMLAKGGFNATKFFSSNRKLMGKLPQDLVIPEMESGLKFLGQSYDAQKDKWFYDTRNFTKDLSKMKLSKRVVLSITQSLFDPRGMLNPIKLPFKFFLHELWTKEYKWDTPLESKYVERFTSLFEGGDLLRNFEFKRRLCDFPRDEIDRVEIHLFSDGSKKAISANAYAVFHAKDGKACSSLLMTHDKMAPSKKGKR